MVIPFVIDNQERECPMVGRVKSHPNPLESENSP